MLLDKLSMDDLVKLFIMHKILNEDDEKVILFAPSEYLKNQFLLEYLWHLKLSVWSVISNIFVNTTSMTHVGNQLIEGKLLFIDSYIATYYLHMYVRML